MQHVTKMLYVGPTQLNFVAFQYTMALNALLLYSHSFYLTLTFLVDDDEFGYAVIPVEKAPRRQYGKTSFCSTHKLVFYSTSLPLASTVWV